MSRINRHARTTGQSKDLLARGCAQSLPPATTYRLSTLSLAVAAALSVMAAMPAQADAPITGQVQGGYTWSGGDLTIDPGASISGGTTGVTAGGASLGTLSNSGTIDSGVANNRKTIAAINNASGGSITTYGTAINNNGGTILSLNNDGLISGSSFGVANNSSRSHIGTLVNNGTISSTGFNGVYNEGTIDTLINNSGGVISGGSLNAGIYNMGHIGVLSNSGRINGGTSHGTYSYGIQNAERGTIDTLNNNSGGTIYGQYSGVYNYTSSGSAIITELNNNGLIDGVVAGVYNDTRGRIATLNNLGGGTINAGLFNAGTITTLNNAGTIIDTSTAVTSVGPYSTVDGITAIHNARGLIGTLSNSGLISAVNAIVIDANATITTLTNSGTIAGNIINNSSRVQTISGGTGSVFGTLTGLNGSIGQITNTSSNWVFGSGNQILNDNIDVGANTVVNSAGVVQINKQIAITGNYQQNIAATLNIGVGSSAIANGDISDTGYGRLIVSGAAVIDAGSNVMLKKNGAYRFANGQRYLVVQAANAGTSYNEGALQYKADGYGGDITGSTIADGANLDLLLTLDGEIINPATNANGQSSLEGLFKYAGTDAALMNLFNAAVALDASGAANRAGAQLNPSSGTFGIAGSSDALARQVNGLAFNRLDYFSLATSTSSNGLSGGDGMSDKAAWGQAFGGRASDDGRDGVSGYHASYTGLLVGVDTPLNDRWRAGGLFSYAATSVSNDGNNAGSYANVDSYGLTAYAGYTGEPWYVNMAVGAVRGDIDAHRVIDFTGFNGVANSSYNSMQYTAAVQGGYPIKVDDTVVTPLAGLTYSSLRLDGYTETGGNGAALHVEAADTHSVKSDLGIKIDRAYKTSYGFLKPTVQLGWRHEYSDTRLQSVANFAADTSGATTFVTEGAKPVADTGVLSFGATLLRNENLTLSVNYTLEQGGGYRSQTGDLLARWRF